MMFKEVFSSKYWKYHIFLILETASSNRDPATESVRDMGYTDEMIKRAIDNIKQNNPGKVNIILCI